MLVDWNVDLFNRFGVECYNTSKIEEDVVALKTPKKKKKIQSVVASLPSPSRIQNSTEYCWTCKSCTLSNPYHRRKCTLCSTRRDLKNTVKMSRLMRLAVRFRGCRREAEGRGVSWMICGEVWDCWVEGCMRRVVNSGKVRITITNVYFYNRYANTYIDRRGKIQNTVKSINRVFWKKNLYSQ